MTNWQWKTQASSARSASMPYTMVKMDRNCVNLKPILFWILRKTKNTTKVLTRIEDKYSYMKSSNSSPTSSSYALKSCFADAFPTTSPFPFFLPFGPTWNRNQCQFIATTVPLLLFCCAYSAWRLVLWMARLGAWFEQTMQYGTSNRIDDCVGDCQNEELIDQ